MVVTMTLAMIRVELKAKAETSSLIPSALRFFSQQSGSPALNMLASAPTTTNSASPVDPSNAMTPWATHSAAA